MSCPVTHIFQSLIPLNISELFYHLLTAWKRSLLVSNFLRRLDEDPNSPEPDIVSQINHNDMSSVTCTCARLKQVTSNKSVELRTLKWTSSPDIGHYNTTPKKTTLKRNKEPTIEEIKAAFGLAERKKNPIYRALRSAIKGQLKAFGIRDKSDGRKE